MYDEISTGIKIRSRCDLYDFGEKSNKLFLNLEKHHTSQNTIKLTILRNKKLLIFIKFFPTY